MKKSFFKRLSNLIAISNNTEKSEKLSIEEKDTSPNAPKTKESMDKPFRTIYEEIKGQRFFKKNLNNIEFVCKVSDQFPIHSKKTPFTRLASSMNEVIQSLSCLQEPELLNFLIEYSNDDAPLSSDNFKF